MFQAQPNNFCCCLEATDVKISLTRKHTWRRSTAPRTFAHTCYVHPQGDKHTSLCAAYCSQTEPKLGALQVEQSSAIPSVAVYCGSCGKCVHIIERKSDRRGAAERSAYLKCNHSACGFQNTSEAMDAIHFIL